MTLENLAVTVSKDLEIRHSTLDSAKITTLKDLEIRFTTLENFEITADDIYVYHSVLDSSSSNLKLTSSKLKVVQSSIDTHYLFQIVVEPSGVVRAGRMQRHGEESEFHKIPFRTNSWRTDLSARTARRITDNTRASTDPDRRQGQGT